MTKVPSQDEMQDKISQMRDEQLKGEIMRSTASHAIFLLFLCVFVFGSQKRKREKGLVSTQRRSASSSKAFIQLAGKDLGCRSRPGDLEKFITLRRYPIVL